ncbi:MAG: hypothetical protein ACRDTJ_29210, partial [Pseudonocardiaceae bacterium]
AKSSLDSWTQRRDQLRSSVEGSLTRDWFSGGNDSVWGGGAQSGTAAFAQQQWRKQAADAQQLTRVIANLRKNGASDNFVAEILRSQDPLAAAKMFNEQTKAGMLQSQRLFQTARHATVASSLYSTAIYADEQRRATSELSGLRKDLSTLKAQLARNHNQAEATRKRESAAAAAGKGARDRR